MRKGASKVSSVPKDILDQLEKGTLESATLSEGLAINFANLLSNAFPELPKQTISQVDPSLGISKRMAQVAAIVVEAKGANAIKQLETHPSDTIRGWACFAIAAQPDAELSDKFDQLKNLTNDDHFGVREWAWLAVRPFIVEDPQSVISHLTPWTENPSENIRRFAVEATRPRGVWSKHIDVLKETPQIALPILAPLKSDPSRYVQNSLGNWLNDAFKSQPDWVVKICDKWSSESQSKETSYIVKRGLRSQKLKS